MQIERDKESKTQRKIKWQKKQRQKVLIIKKRERDKERNKRKRDRQSNIRIIDKTVIKKETNECYTKGETKIEKQRSDRNRKREK